MSLVVTVHVPTGIVMAADSRMTGTVAFEHGEGEHKAKVQQQLVLSDSAYKVVELKTVGVGMSLYDAGVIDNQPMESHVRRFEEESLSSSDDVRAVADKFMTYLQNRHPTASVGFHVGGHRVEGKASVPYVLVAHTVHEKTIRRVNATTDGVIQYGIAHSGDVLVANRLVDKNYLPRFDAMPIQDAIDYAVHLIRTTIDTLRFEPRYPSVGGPIDVLVLKPDGMQWVQRKELHGEG